MRSIIVLAAAAMFASGAFAQAVQSDQDHAAHHPAGASAAAPAIKGAAKPAKKVAKPADKASAPSAMQMDAMMQSMKDMHDKMMAAKTTEERQALMDEHMKTMKDGMSMMGQMKGGQPGMGMRGKEGMPSQEDMMSKRMDMMEMMMQMMMDREAARSMPAK